MMLYMHVYFKHTIHISDSAAGHYVPATAEVIVETNGWVDPTCACILWSLRMHTEPHEAHSLLATLMLPLSIYDKTMTFVGRYRRGYFYIVW